MGVGLRAALPVVFSDTRCTGTWAVALEGARGGLTATTAVFTTAALTATGVTTLAEAGLFVALLELELTETLLPTCTTAELG